jgi:hypothetical protein
MGNGNLGPASESGAPSQDLGSSGEVIDLTTGGAGTSAAAGGPGSETPGTETTPRPLLEPYVQQRQMDYVRLIVTVGLLLIFGFVVVWSCIESASWPDHWKQTKEMLPYIMPALTGLIGSVIGFYFGSGVNGTDSKSLTK